MVGDYLELVGRVQRAGLVLCGNFRLDWPFFVYFEGGRSNIETRRRIDDETFLFKVGKVGGKIGKLRSKGGFGC